MDSEGRGRSASAIFLFLVVMLLAMASMNLSFRAEYTLLRIWALPFRHLHHGEKAEA